MALKAITKTDVGRWQRVFELRRALVPHVMVAGLREPLKHEKGPQKFVCLTDAFDDVLYTALAHEAARERRKQERKQERRKL